MSREHATSASAAGSAASSYAASSAAAASSSSAAAAAAPAASASASSSSYVWPWVARDKNDLPIRREDLLLPGLPTKHSLNLPRDIAKFDIGLAKGDRSFHAWNTFTNIRGKFAGWLASPDLLSHRNCASEYHDLGLALMEESNLKDHLKYAIKAFERDYAISCTIHKAKMESIAGLRQLAACSLELKDYVAAVRYAEQALTNAVQSHQVLERQGAVMALGLICMHWFDNACLASRKDDQGELIMSEYDSWGLVEREQLLDQTRAFMLHAQALASKLPDDEEKKAELVLEAKINLANSLQQRCAFLSLKHTHTKRLLELKKELAELPSALYTPQLQTDAELRAVLTRIDLSPFAPSHPFDSFKLTPPGAVELYKQVKTILDDAETHCFDEPLWAERWSRTPLPDLGPRWEIDEPAMSVPKRVQVAPHSKVLHLHGMVLESLGLVEDSLKRYLSSVRRLNCLRGPAELSITRKCSKGYTQIVDDQCVSLKAALLAYLKLDQYDRATSMAQQLKKLNNEAKNLLSKKDEKLSEAYKLERDRAKELVKIIQRKRTHFQQLEGIKAKLAAWKPEHDPTLVQRYALISERRDVYMEAVDHARNPDDEGLDDSKQTKGFNVQGMLNAEREMWRIVRTQRKRLHPQRDAAEWAASLRQEGHLIISIAQSVCTMSDLLFADSPVKQMERQLCDKYWLLARQWQQRVLPPVVGRSFPEWEGMALIEHAQALHDLRDNEQTVLNLRLEAWAQLDRVDPQTRARLLFNRKCVAESIVDTLKLQAARPSATQAKRASYVEWKSIFDSLSAEWTTLTEATDAASALRVYESENMDAVFEGREMPAMGDKSAAGDDSSPLSEAEDEAEVVRPLVRPPSSKPIPALADPHSATAAAASRAPKAAGPSNGQNSIQGFMGSSASSAAAASVVTVAAPASSVASSVVSSKARTAPRGAAITRAAPGSSSDRNRKRRRITVVGSQSSGESEDDAADAASSSDDDDAAEVRDLTTVDGEVEMEIIDMTTAPQAPAAAVPTVDRRVRFAEAPAVSSTSRTPLASVRNAGDVQILSASVIAPHTSATVLHSSNSGLNVSTAASVAAASVAVPSRPALAAPSAAVVAASSKRTAPSQRFVSSAVHTIADEWREELVVALRQLESDRGQCQQLALLGDRFSLAAREELCLVMRMEAAEGLPCKPLGQLQSLDMSFSTMEEDAWWTWILIAVPKLPRLRSLNLSHTTVASNMAAHLDRCISRSPLLRSINLTGCNRMTGADRSLDSSYVVQALTSNPALEELTLTGCPMSLTTVAQLLRGIRSCGLTSLRVLSLSFVRALCYRLSAAEGEDSVLPAEPEDAEPHVDEASANAAWRSYLLTPALLGSRDLALVREVYAGLAEWLVDCSQSSLCPDIHLSLSGWSNGLSLLSTLLRVLSFPSCRLCRLDLLESELGRAQLTQLTDAIARSQSSPQTVPALQTIQFSPIDKTQSVQMAELLTRALPSNVTLIGEPHAHSSKHAHAHRRPTAAPHPAHIEHMEMP